ncbi:uncharacterized protein LOC144706164 [Wolffia australiana]
MKTLYPKGKGKIHPSPACGTGEALAVLNLLPAAILALTAALGAEDKEVLAYLVTRSLQVPCSVAAEERRRCRRLGHHPPLFDCGCFDCYTSFWFRWDCSPDRELIHQAIEAFEEHLASSEQRRGGGKAARRRDRRLSDKSGKPKSRRKGPSSEGEEISAVEEAGPSSTIEESIDFEGERELVVSSELCPDAEEEAEVEISSGEAMGQSLPASVERRRPWVDVMGIFGTRFWNLWCPSP